ncbi:fumarylacetoacetate hydrolase family protein [Streptomyces fractus]|uniref:fumarylacetoacetate hydrolase family protein n=1 Tax=Streptomyces fractus TaxID=641806 RepID=UPI003CF00A6B
MKPGKVVVIGRNYADRTGDSAPDPAGPIIFLKPATSVIGSGGTVEVPADLGEVRFEGELAVVIGERCKNVPTTRYRDVVRGYTCADDITAWDLGQGTRQWSRAKSYDTFCPLGPTVVEDLDPDDLAIVTTVNGAVRQKGSTSQMVRPVPELIAAASRLMTLEPGDVILTGTPDGSGPVRDGDEVRITVEGIGTLAHAVRMV